MSLGKQIYYAKMYPVPIVEDREVFGVRISRVSIDQILSRIASICRLPGKGDFAPAWIERHETRTLCLVNAFSVVEANQNARHMDALRNATACLADGLGVALLARTPKIAGADLMLAAARHPELGKMGHVLLGGFGVAYKAAMRQWADASRSPHPALIQWPWIPAVDSDADLVFWANSTPCDILWVALGCPKQEIWMHENRNRLNAKVVIGVGAAFDFLAGRIRRAPRWMQRTGLEWAWRIIQEPTRWRRQVGAAVGFLRLLLR